MSRFNFIYAEEELGHRAKTVYVYLRDRSDASGVCWPGIKTIARELGLSPRTVQRALGDLEHFGRACQIKEDGEHCSPSSFLPFDTICCGSI